MSSSTFPGKLGTTLFSWFEAGHKISIISTLQEWANLCPATPTHPMLTNHVPQHYNEFQAPLGSSRKAGYNFIFML